MTTTDADRLREQLIKSPFLIIDCENRRASLASKSEMLAALGDNAFVVTHALAGYDGLTRLSHAQREFTLNDIAKITGEPYSRVYNWVLEKVLVASIRPGQGSGPGNGPVFSFCDAVAAGIVGSLRRAGVGLEILRLVAPAFTKNRTTGRVATAQRS